MKELFTEILKLINNIPFAKKYIEKRNYHVSLSKEIFTIFPRTDFDSFTNNLFNAYFYLHEKQKIDNFNVIFSSKKFLNKKYHKNLNRFHKKLFEFVSWSLAEFSLDDHSDRIKLDKYTKHGDLIPGYDSKVQLCQKYANELMDLYDKVYFKIQKDLPEVFIN